MQRPGDEEYQSWQTYNPDIQSSKLSRKTSTLPHHLGWLSPERKSPRLWNERVWALLLCTAGWPGVPSIWQNWQQGGRAGGTLLCEVVTKGATPLAAAAAGSPCPVIWTLEGWAGANLVVEVLAHLKDKSRKILGYNAEYYYYLRSTSISETWTASKYYFCQVQVSRKITSFPLIHENENNATHFLGMWPIMLLVLAGGVKMFDYFPCFFL